MHKHKDIIIAIKNNQVCGFYIKTARGLTKLSKLSHKIALKFQDLFEDFMNLADYLIDKSDSCLNKAQKRFDRAEAALEAYEKMKEEK